MWSQLFYEHWCAVFAFILVTAVPSIRSQNWCSSKLKCGKDLNTMCTYREEANNRCKDIKNAMNPTNRQLLLMVHNKLRQEVALGAFKSPNNTENWPKAGNMRQITWDYGLEKVATRWAVQCQSGKDKCRKTPEYDMVWQSVWSNWSSIGHPTPNDAYENFRGYVKYFNTFPEKYTEDNKAHPYGMFTQMIWADTYKIGCGFAHYKKDDQLWSGIACNYAPAGNIESAKLYEPLPASHPPPPAQKKCPAGWIIRDPRITVYPDLCALPTDPPIEVPIPDVGCIPNALLYIPMTVTFYVSQTILLHYSLLRAHPNDFNYWCSEDANCKIGKKLVQNTMCIFKNQSGIGCEGGVKIVTSPEDRYILLALHNTFRNRLAAGKLGWPKAANMRQMSWDSKLELVASRWAMQCIEGHDDCRRTPEFSVVGQNCGSVGSPARFLGHDVVFQLWAGQLHAAPKSLVTKFKFGQEYAEFAQVSWANSHKLGCSVVHFKKDLFFTVLTVCNYGPGGALKGQKMYQKGRPCDRCSPGTGCKWKTTYRQLCALPGDPINEKLPPNYKEKGYGSAQPRSTTAYSILLFVCLGFGFNELKIL